MPSVIPAPPPSAGGDDRFHFSPGTANPELWATTTPLVVVHRCRRHKGLIATWRAIHWLIVLHSRSGRADFGVREIAEEADVGRNELCDTHDTASGEVVKKGYISLLCDARLIDIVGQVAVPGGRRPRNVYSVDLARLIAESALLVPEVLRSHGALAPPRPQLHPDRRYVGPSQGTAAYWLVRAMNTVALDDKPLALSYVGGVLKRLKRSGRWDSEELALAAGETREDGGSTPGPPPPESKRRARDRPRDPAADLPADLREAAPVATYMRYAPAGIALAEPWAREIQRRVSDLALWESHCQNWRSKYDYSNVRGLLERHETDVRAIHPAPAASGGGREPPADPLAAIAERLSLEEQERIIAIADAIEERHGLDRGAWTWVLVALADGCAPEEVEREALSRFSRAEPTGAGGHR